MKNLFVRLLLTFLFLAPVSALAQSGSRVVAVCGTLPAPYAAGSTQPPTVDVNGVTCSNASGGGGGGAVTIADGADVTQGAIADAASTAGGVGTLSAKLRLMTTQLGTINTTLGSPLQAGGTIGNTAFGISGTLPAFAAPPAVTLVSTTITGNTVVVGPTADGSAASTPPILIAGTTDGTATGLVAVPKVTAGGVLSVDGSASTQPISAAALPLPTGAATSAAQTTMATNQTAVQAPVAPGAATATKANLIGGQYNSAVQAFTNGQQGSLQFDQRGGLLVQDGQAIPSVSVTSAATLFTVADTSGYGSISVQVTSAGSATIIYETGEDGITWVPTAGYNPTSTGTSASVTTSTTATQLIFPLLGKQFHARVSTYTSGTVTVQGTLKKDTIARNSIAIGNNVTVVGNTAEAAAVGSTSIQASYEGRTTNKTAVATGQNVRPIATSIGAAVNKPFQIPELDWSYPAAAGGITNTTTAVTMVAAAGAGIRNYVTGCQLSSTTLGAATEIAIRDGAAGTVIWRANLTTTALGFTAIQLPSPIKSTANTLLEFVTLTASITGSVYINCQGYQAP